MSKALDDVVSPSVSTAAKGAAKSTNAMGTMTAVGILITLDFGALISDAVDLAKIEKGKIVR